MPTFNNIADMLQLCNFQTEGRRIMLARHTLNNQPKSLVHFVTHAPENFAEWQCVQNKEKRGGSKSVGAQLADCDYVMAFCSVKGAGFNARFAGVFRNNSDNPPKTLDIDRDLSPELARIYREDKPPMARYFFQFCKEPGFEEWEGRVIIEWDEHFHRWVADFSPKRVAGIGERSNNLFAAQQ